MQYARQYAQNNNVSRQVKYSAIVVSVFPTGVAKEKVSESGCGQRESQTVWPIKLEKRDRHSTLLLPPGLQTFILHFYNLWMCPVQKWS